MATEHDLNSTFAALSDGTRRAIVERLLNGDELSVSAIAEPFDMSLPAVLKHVKVLENAGLVSRSKIGRTVHCRLNPKPMKSAAKWLQRMELFWENRLDSLANYVEAGTAPTSRSRKKK